MNTEGSPFRTGFNQDDRPSSPEELYGNLRKKQIMYLWSHQADILRNYEENEDKQDIAFELPTGTGKTLIGLLIGEYRRKKHNERIVYLCPTRQLAFQVSNLAKDYGIVAHALVGKQSEYPIDKFSSYITNSSIAITTYSGVFNSNPRIDSPNVIILDDAHSAEGYISSLWTITLRRHRQPDLFMGFINLIKDSLEPRLFRDLINDELPYLSMGDIDCVPHPLIYSYQKAIIDYFDEHLKETENQWSWSLIRNHLYACNIYISWSSVEIRPMIPPTFSHDPFNNATQRLYMSATLGEGGELERIAGVTKIHRLPIPEGWEKRSTGRRFILFPNLSLEDDSTEELINSLLDTVPRTLILTPSKWQATEVEQIIDRGDINIQILRNQDIEDSLIRFIDESNQVLLLTNRYDGIDLPDDNCRFEIIYGLPSTTNNQEKFYLTRLGADVLLKNRIRTRISQALGRCVRNESDYALILMVGGKIGDFCARSENSKGLHPEIQAELYYGIENSMGQSIEGFKLVAEHFLSQTAYWEEVDKEIINLRSKKEIVHDPSVEMLEKASVHEVNYCKAIWNSNFEHSQSDAQSVLDYLHGDSVKSYRGWWYYLAGYSAWLYSTLSGKDHDMNKAHEMFSKASNTTSTVSWLVRLKHLIGSQTKDLDDGYLISQAAENIMREVHATPLQGLKFESRMKRFISEITNMDAGHFERGLEELGKLLGYESYRPEGEGTPDCIWSIYGYIHFALEAKSEQIEEGVIGKKDILQTKAHIDWLKANKKIPEDDDVLPIIISDREEIHQDSMPHIENVYKLGVSDVQELASEVVDIYRRLRAKFNEEGKDEIIKRNMIIDEFSQNKLFPENIYSWIIQHGIDKLTVI